MADVTARLHDALAHSHAIFASYDGNELAPQSDGARELLGDEAPVREALARIVTSVELRDGHAETEARLVDAHGHERWLLLEISTMPDAAGLLVVGHDVSDRHAREVDLARRAVTDALTGLPNRIVLADRLGQVVLAGARTQSTASLLLLDLDRFKEVNDTFGHPAGDTMLREVGQRIRDELRSSDTVARLGGDEFAVLLPPPSDALSALATARKIQRALARPFGVRGGSARVSASIGIALFPGHASTVDVLVDRADAAMYAAKRTTSGIAMYDPEHDMRSPRILAELEAIAGAIDAGRLDLQYQPTVRLADGEALRAEALVRLVQPSGARLRPDSFLGLAERGGHGPALSAWVLRNALARCRQWLETGVETGVSINVALRDLVDSEFPARIRAELAASGVPASSLTLEISERVVGEDLGRLERPLKELAATGVRLALDDFGSGSASLTLLQRLPLSEVKLDRRFITDMLTNRASWKFVRSGIDAAHDLGLEVTAEGVEDDATAYVLERLGCDVAQGHYFTGLDRAPFPFLARSELDTAAQLN